MSKYIDGTRIVYFDDSNGNLTVPSTLAVGSLSTASVRVSSVTAQTANISTLTTTTQTGSSASISSLTTNFVSTGRVAISSIVANNISSTTSRSGLAFVDSLSTPILNISSLTTPGSLFITPIRNDEAVTTGFLHYNLSTNEVVYNAQGGSGGGGTSALVTASTILATESLLAPTQFYAQELYTNTAYDYTQFGTQFTATGPSAVWCGIAVSATGQYMTAIDNGATYPTGGYIYSSSNFGNTWNQVASQQGWGQVAMNATGQIQIAAIGLGPNGYNGQIYRSTDYGATWSILTNSFYTYWASLSVSASGQYMVGTDHFTGFNTAGYVYTSSDYGITWARLTSLPFVVLGPIRVSASGQYQTVTGQGIPLYRSTDYGQTWSSTGTSDRYAGVAVSASGQYQTATSFTFDGGSGSIYVSADYGATWTVYGSTGIIYRAVAISASGKYQAVYVINSGVYYSTNYGQTWTFVASPNAFLYGIAMSAAGNYVVLVARDPQQRIYINSLPLLQVATTSLTASNAAITSLTATTDIVAGRNIFSQNTLNTNILNLSAFAQSFSLVNSPGTFNYTSAVSATGQYQLVGTSTYLYVSSNFGTTWTQVATVKDWTGVAISGAGNYMYAVDSTASTGNIYRSTDFGLTWAVVSSSPGAGAYLWVAISASGQYVLTLGPSYYYLSSNYGATFTQVENFSSASFGFVAVSATGQYMMIRTLSSNVVSNNYGATWTPIFPTSDGYALAISGTGQYQMAQNTATNTMYLSSDYGATFAAVLATPCWSCAIDYTGQYQVIARLPTNIYYSVNYGVTWSIATNYPNPTQSRSVSMSANAQYLLAPNANGPFYLNRNSVWFPAGISTTTAQVSSLTTNSITNSGSFFVNSLRSDPTLTTGIVRYNSTTQELVFNELGGGGTQSTISSFQNAYVSSLGINCNSPQFVLDVNGTGNFISTLTPFASISTANISTANISTANISSAQVNALFVSSASISSIVANTVSTNTLTTFNNFFSWRTTTTADGLATISTASLNAGSSNFTMECYFNPIAYQNTWNTIMSLNTAASNANQGHEFRLATQPGGSGYVLSVLYPIGPSSDGQMTTVNILPTNTWYHLALVRTSATNLSLFSNGVAILSTTTLNYTSSENRRLQFFNNPYSADGSGQGYINSARLTIGQALYTGNFTPPTQQLNTTTIGTSGSFVAANFTSPASVVFLGAVTSTFTDVSPSALSLTATGTPSSALFAPTSFRNLLTAGYLGLNCNAPRYNLDVNGSANFNGALNMTNLPDNNVLITSGRQQIPLSNTASAFMYMQAPGNRIRIGAYSNTSGMPFTINESGGNVGINCNAPAYTLDVNGSGRISTFIVGSSNLPPVFSTNDHMFVNGFFDIYNSAQASTLIRMAGAFGANYIQSGTASTVSAFAPADLIFGSPAAASEYVRFTSTGRVGINCNAPQNTLDVNGTARIKNDRGVLTLQGEILSDSLYVRFQKSTLQGFIGWFGTGIQQDIYSSIFGIVTPASTSIEFLPGGTTAASPLLFLGSNSQIGILTNTPAYTLDVNGTINASIGVRSNGTFLTSDRRIKQFISDADLDICYDNVKNLPLRRYEYISSFKTTKIDGKQIGFIADEVQALFPKSVKEFPTSIDEQFSSIQHLNYDQIFLAHYGATKKLMSVVERQTAQLVEQSTQIAQLLTDNSTLISYIPQLVSTLQG